MEDSARSVTHGVLTQLPIARVKKIFRLDSNCATISAEAVQLLTFATECFISLLAKVAYGQAAFDKRKTIQLRDLEFCIKNYEPFNFLDGTLDGWPEVNRGKYGFDGGSSVNMPTKRSEKLVPPDSENEQEDLNVDANGLSDEIFGFDELLDGTEPFDAQNAEKDNAVTSKNAEIINNVVREAQSIKLKIFGHYGHYLPMNSTAPMLIQTTDVEVGANIMRNKKGEKEMKVVKVTDAPTQYDSLNRTEFKMGISTVDVLSNTQSSSNQDTSQLSTGSMSLSN